MKNLFRQLRWKLTLSYILVTVGALLVSVSILAAIIYTQVFMSANVLTPEGMVKFFQTYSVPYIQDYLIKEPIDPQVLELTMEVGMRFLTTKSYVQIGAVQFSIQAVASLRSFIISPEGILLARSDIAYLPSIKVGQPFDITRVPGLEGPFRAAMAGETHPKLLYSVQAADSLPDWPVDRFVIAIPLFGQTSGEAQKMLGIFVVIADSFPNQKDITANVLQVLWRSLLIFLLGAGIMGAFFGLFFAHGLSRRFGKLTAAIDAWSQGDFSKFIEDSTGDEVSRFAQRLNEMAQQLQSLLFRKQEMAVLKERNRLARNLHDSAKQQALAASFELGTALVLLERDPQKAKKHLRNAETLVDTVRKDLTNLVAELRLPSLEGDSFNEILESQALDWSQRSGIELDFALKGAGKLTIEMKENLLRIFQEALANIARHSAASHAEATLSFGVEAATLLVRDDGAGFDLQAPHEGIGIASMRERAESAGGSFSIRSAPGQGTEINVKLPLKGGDENG